MPIFLISITKLEYIVFDKLCDVQARSLKIEISVNIIVEIIIVMCYTSSSIN
jgi:hypothetical protein